MRSPRDGRRGTATGIRAPTARLWLQATGGQEGAGDEPWGTAGDRERDGDGWVFSVSLSLSRGPFFFLR